MTTFNANVKSALGSQADLETYGEHCSADPEKLATIGRATGQQVRVTVDGTHYGNYTVSQTLQENPDDTVRMGAAGFSRLLATNDFAAVVSSVISHPTYTDAEAEANSEFVERLTDNGTHTELVATAPHGGMIENFTDLQAERVAYQLAAREVSSWRCKGWHSTLGAFPAWHLSATEITRASFPLLDSIGSRGFTHCVAFHGWIYDSILIGGAAPMALKLLMQTAIQNTLTGTGIVVDVTVGGGDFGGDSLANFCNWLTAGGANGIQIEQGQNALESHWQAIADAVASVYETKLAEGDPVPPVLALIDKNLLTDQTWKHISKKFNVNIAFGTKGLGQAANVTTTFLIDCGGFNNQKITGTVRYAAPTAVGSEFIGLMLRCVQLDGTSNYYWAGLYHGTCILLRVLDGVFTVLKTNPFVTGRDQDVNITFSAVDTTLTATFDAGGSPATVTQTITDANLQGGFTGSTSINSAIWTSHIKVEQL